MPSTRLIGVLGHRQALTLSETLIAAALIGLLLALCALVLGSMRRDLKTRQVQELLRTLDRGLAAYHENTESYPVAGGTIKWPNQMNSTPLTGVDKETAAAAIDVIEQLRRVPQASQTLNGIPVGLRLSNNDGRWISIQDAWGSPLRCLTEQSASASDRQTVAANGGRPLFMSAGPDRLFGANNVTAMGDDLMLHPTLNH